MVFRSSLALTCVFAALNLASSDKIYMKAELKTSNVFKAKDSQAMPKPTDGSGYATLVLDTDAKSLTYKARPLPCRTTATSCFVGNPSAAAGVFQLFMQVLQSWHVTGAPGLSQYLTAHAQHPAGISITSRWRGPPQG